MFVGEKLSNWIVTVSCSSIFVKSNSVVAVVLIAKIGSIVSLVVGFGFITVIFSFLKGIST